MAAETLQRRKPPLNRGCSEPVNLPNVLDEEDTEDEDEVEEEKTNILVKSFNSTGGLQKTLFTQFLKYHRVETFVFVSYTLVNHQLYIDSE